MYSYRYMCECVLTVTWWANILRKNIHRTGKHEKESLLYNTDQHFWNNLFFASLKTDNTFHLLKIIILRKVYIWFFKICKYKLSLISRKRKRKITKFRLSQKCENEFRVGPYHRAGHATGRGGGWGGKTSWVSRYAGWRAALTHIPGSGSGSRQ